MSVTNLSSAFATRTLCAVSDMQRFEFSTDAEALEVSLSHAGASFYRATLYAFEGHVTAEGMDQVIGDYMLARGLHRITLSVRAFPPGVPEDAVEMQVDTLYCAYTLPEGYDLSVAFFSLLQTQRVPPSAILEVYGDITQGDPVSFRIPGYKSDGSPDSCELTKSASGGSVGVNIDLLSKEAARDHGITKVTSVSLFYGDTVKSFVVLDMPSFLEFRFRNCFNCLEWVYVSGTSEMVTDISRDTAVCNGRALQYNQTVIRSYEHTTAPLTRIEAAAMSQLVESRDVRLRLGYELVPVVITDHELKVSNDDSSLNSAKFTWRFADSRPRLFGSTLSPLHESFGIFTHEFQDPYQ